MGRIWGHSCATVLRMLAALFLVVSGLGAGGAAAQERLDGTYYGIDAAMGLTLSIQETANGATGRIAATDGSGQDIEGRREGAAIVTDLIFRGKQGTARLIPKDIGLGFTWTPNDGSGGEVVFAFGRRGLELPPPSPSFVPEDRIGGNVGPHIFVASYEFWSPGTVTRVYDLMDDKYRTIIQLFPAVQTDLIWKLCQSDTKARGLGAALRGEGVTCAQVDTRLKNAQKTGAFNLFKRRVHSERADAERAVQCARGIHPPHICAESAKRTQAAAISLETVMTVLRGI